MFKHVFFAVGFALVDIVIFTSLIFVILILYLMIRKVKWNPQSEHIEVRMTIA